MLSGPSGILQKKKGIHRLKSKVELERLEPIWAVWNNRVQRLQGKKKQKGI